MRRIVIFAVAAAALLAAGWLGLDYFLRGQYIEATDDAYVKADIAEIAARISGYVVEVSAQENQVVHEGDILLRIDDADFRAKVDQATATVALKNAALKDAEATLVWGKANVTAAEAQLASAKADAERASADLVRATNLKQRGAASVQQYDQALSDQRQAKAAVEAQAATLAAQREQITVLQTHVAQAAADIDGAKAALELARIDLANTIVRAPFDGVTANRAVERGQYARAGALLLSVVPLPDVYVVANFKETQAGTMRRGQPASIEVDAFPGEVIEGIVESFAPATGSEFSLLPPENATGNFTKIVQRVPVRIRIRDHEGIGALLRPGMSVTVSIDTREEGEGAQARLAPSPRTPMTAGR